MVLVPITAKIVDHFHGDLTIFGLAIQMPISLPFSWPCFYFASLFFAIASFVFSLRCPSLIADYSDGRDFLDRGGHSAELKNQIRAYWDNLPECPVFEIVSPDAAVRRLTFIKMMIWHMTRQESQALTEEIARSVFERGTFNEGAIIDGYSDAKRVLENVDNLARTVCKWSYFSGFALLGLVVCQNTWFVVKVVLRLGA